MTCIKIANLRHWKTPPPLTVTPVEPSVSTDYMRRLLIITVGVMSVLGAMVTAFIVAMR